MILKLQVLGKEPLFKIMLNSFLLNCSEERCAAFNHFISYFANSTGFFNYSRFAYEPITLDPKWDNPDCYERNSFALVALDPLLNHRRFHYCQREAIENDSTILFHLLVVFLHYKRSL